VDAYAAEQHHQELATFVSVHADGPAVLWPEYDHPAYDLSGGERFDILLAQALGRLTGVPVQTVRGSGNVSAAKCGRIGAPTLAHQMAGTSLWTVRPKTPGGDEFRCSLRRGEVLFIPVNRMWFTRGLSTSDPQFLLSFFQGRPVRDG
jgi:hypothetical protein